MATRTARTRSSSRRAECPPSMTMRSSKSGRSESGRTSLRSHGRTQARGSSSRGQVRGAGRSTTDHEQIRRWVEERGGKPACVRGTGGRGDTGMLRIDMPGYSGKGKLAHIPWDEWFDNFDEKNLAFLYQDKTKGGRKSNFNKLVER